MNIKIPCSIGELVDKITILKIKYLNSKDNINYKNKSVNIKKELDLLEEKLPSFVEKEYLIKLQEVNQKLWNLEDNIRLLSKKKQFDNTYIKYAESIHKQNDKRYSIKNEINIKYNSEIIEEKIFTDKEKIKKIDIKDYSKKSKNNYKILKYAQYLYNIGNVIKCEEILDYLFEIKKNCPLDDFMAELYLSQYTLTSHIGKKYEYQDKLELISLEPEKYIISNEKILYFKKMYSLYTLSQGKYDAKYCRYFNEVTNKDMNINPDTISFFKDNINNNKSLLIYCSGGLGDTIMFGRFLNIICENFTNKNIFFFVQAPLVWLYRILLKKYNNILISSFNNNLLDIDHHTNIAMLPFHLGVKNMNEIVNYEYKYINNLNLKINNKLLDSIISKKKPNIVINWHGSYQNKHELLNRGINLKLLEPIFNYYKDKINFISIQKEVLESDKIILKKYNIIELSNKIDLNGKAFYDTISILKEIDLFISTDTSLLHLAGSMGINSIGLIAKGCEWRWKNGIKEKYETPWYPDMKIIRQEKYGNWNNVISSIKENINKILN